MATKAKAKPAPKAKRKPPPLPETVLNAHPFSPEQKVEIHLAEQVEIERRENRRPAPKPVEIVTVSKQGEIKAALKPGSYVVAGEVEKQQLAPHSEPYTVWEFVAWTV